MICWALDCDVESFSWVYAQFWVLRIFRWKFWLWPLTAPLDSVVTNNLTGAVRAEVTCTYAPGRHPVIGRSVFGSSSMFQWNARIILHNAGGFNRAEGRISLHPNPQCLYQAKVLCLLEAMRPGVFDPLSG